MSGTSAYAQQDGARQAAALFCQYYLRLAQSYKLLQHLPQIGSRMRKNWFVVQQRNEPDQMMVMSPHSELCLIPMTVPFKKALDGLFLLLHHPFVLPISNVDLLKEQGNIVMMTPLSGKGSLKDRIYKTNPILPWRNKYMAPGKPIPMDKIILWGRQILEGMLFLKKKQIPYRNLHSGNVIIENEKCRISGYENPLFGYTPKMMHRAGKALGAKDKDPLGLSFDMICFGHVLFEMAMGYELLKTRPDVEQLVGKCCYELVELFVFIFFHPDDRIPTLEEVMNQDHVLFKGITCHELAGFHPAPPVYTKEIKQVLRAVQKNTAIK
jgi:PX domain-containing protein kinase-like protein